MLKQVFSAVLAVAGATAMAQTVNVDYDPLVKYQDVDSVNQIISVRYTAGTSADVSMYVKTQESGMTAWDEVLSCKAFIGRNGMGKVRAGDKRTPLGDYGMITAFGIKPNPGTKLPYVDVDNDTYCCGDRTAYNRIINIKHMPHKCRGEHMINYNPDYNYGFFFDYNKDCVVGKGAALFFHCTGDSDHTAGCVAVDEENMATILRTIDKNARLVISDPTK